MSGSVTLAECLAVATGASVGALARWGSGLAFNALWAGFPLGTLLVNCLGGLLIGVAMVWFQRSPHEVWRLFIVTGFLGGFTTFSSFSAESLGLLQRGEAAMAAAHTLAHVLGALAFTALGFALARVVLPRL
jgi:CrcB protein